MPPFHLPNVVTTESATEWMDIVDRHLVRCLSVPSSTPPSTLRSRVGVLGREAFRGGATSGALASLPYLHVTANGAVLEHAHIRAYLARTAAAAPARRRHSVVMQVAGQSVVATQGLSVQLRPGDFVLIDNPDWLRIEGQGFTEQVCVFDALPGELMRRVAGSTLTPRRARSEVTAILTQFVRSLSAGVAWSLPSTPQVVARSARALLADVFHERAVPGPARLQRQAIESLVMQGLEQPDLSIQSLAEALGCSVRTLHRVFQRCGGDTLERFIQLKRVEACAELLRHEKPEQPLSLTDLALRFGFSSSSHFAGAFRQHMGVSASAYRRAARADRP